MNDRVKFELLEEVAGRAAADAIDEASGVLDLAHLITIEGDRLVTGTRAVASEFKRAHKNVVRTIDKMRASKNAAIAEHARLNFEPCIFDYVAGKGSRRQIAGYLMTKDGLTELTMSFTGDRARLIRIRFIAAFNKMAQQLQAQGNSLLSQFFEVEIEFKDGKQKVSASARNMRRWRDTKPRLLGRIHDLGVRIQLSLGFECRPPAED